MKLLLALVLTLSASIAFADAPFTKLGFQAYSSQAGTTCTIFSGKTNLGVDTRGNVIQAFQPDADNTRSYNLKTKGYANYSTQRSPQGSTRDQPVQFWFTCVVNGTAGTYAPTKVYLNGVQTYYLTLSSGVFGGGW